jgi:hypothetical protein
MISNNLKSCIEKLNFIASIKDPIKRKKVLLNLNDECLYKALREIAYNTVIKKVHLSPKNKKELQRHKLKIQKLACFTKNKIQRKKLVVQSGGFLPLLMPLIVSTLASVAGEIIPKLIKKD